MSSISSAALADSVSGSSEQGCEPLRSANETSIAAPSCESTGLTCPASMTYTPLTQTDWLGLDESISSVEASRVSPSASPASRERRKTTATSGRRCAALLHSRDPLGSLVKTLLVSSRWHSTMCWLTWKPSTTPGGRLLFRLVPSMRDTDGTVSGSLLPTPVTVDSRSLFNRSPSSGAARRPTLGAMARYNLWPTPVARDFKGQGMSRERRATREPDNLCSAVAETDGSGPLNPQWVEWLMGFPTGWTELEPSEMPSSRRSSKRSAAQS